MGVEIVDEAAEAGAGVVEAVVIVVAGDVDWD
jgi:hypothetical protein